MSTTNVVIEYYGPVAFSAFICCMAFVYRKLDRIQEMLISLREHDTDTRKDVELLKANDARQDSAIAAVKEAVAVVAAEFEKHEQYHERRI